MPFDIDKIQEIVKEKVAYLKATGKGYKKDMAVPNYNSVYQDSIEHANELAVHIEGTFPAKLLRDKAPNQDTKEWQYQKDLYLPVTMPFMYRALAKVNRIWLKQNWNITFQNEETAFADEPLKKYLEEDYPNYKSIDDYFQQIVTKEKFADPNGVVCHKPLFIPMTSEIDGEKEIQTIDTTVMIQPIAKFYPSWQVIEYIPLNYCLIETQHKSDVKVGEMTKKEGLIYEFYDTENIWFVIQKGKKENYEFDILLYYNHNLGELPCYKLKGIPFERANSIFYKSYFFPAIPHLNDAIRNFSTKQISTHAHAFPQKWELTDGNCDFQNDKAKCVGGYLQNFDPDNKSVVKCSECNGTGVRKSVSATGVRQIAIPKNLSDEKQIPTPPFGWEAPDQTILEFLSRNIDNSTLMAFVFLNMDFSNSNVKGGETALGKMIDRDELFTFLMKISDELFWAYETSINFIGKMRYGSSYKKPTINRPKDFEIRSAFDLTEEIGLANEKGISSFAMIEMNRQYFKTRFSNDITMLKKFDASVAADRLFHYKQIDINAGLGVGTIAKWEAILHDSVWNFIDMLIREDETFLEKETNEQVEMIKAKAKEKATEITPLKNNAESLLASIQP